MEGYKIVIFANTIFDSKGSVRKVKFEIQQYNINFKKCRYCNGNEVKEKYYIAQDFINSQKYLYINLIQLSYPSSPRGAHSILVSNDDFYNSGRNSGFPNTYKGWGNSPANLYIPIKEKIFAIDELEKVNVIAVRNEVPTDNLKYFIGEIYAGQAGNWKFYINVDFKKREIEPELFGHPSCIKRKKFSELDEEDLIKGINREFFEKIGNSRSKSFYISGDGSEVLYEYELYKVYKTGKENIVLLKYNDNIGIDENYNNVYYNTDDEDRVRIYYNENFEGDYDYAVEAVLERKEIEVTE